MARIIDSGPAQFTVRGRPGSSLTIATLWATLEAGPIDWIDISVGCTIGGVNVTGIGGAAQSGGEFGYLKFTLPSSVTTTLGVGSHDWIVNLTTDTGTTTFIHGSVVLVNGGTIGAGSVGNRVDCAMVRGVVVVAGVSDAY